MGNKESSNKEALEKFQQFQQQSSNGSQNIRQYYTNQEIGMHDNHRGYYQNPWEAQQNFQQQKAMPKLKPTQEISGIKNEIFIHKGSLKLIPLQGPTMNQNFLSFQFESMHDCSIKVLQGCFEKIEEVEGFTKVDFYPKKNSNFESMISTPIKFPEGKNQQFPDNVVIINLDNYFFNGEDYSKATFTYYPIIIYMKKEQGQSNAGVTNQYESIYYLQFQFSRGHACTLQIIKQKIIFNGQLFELSEAYGLNSSRTDDSNSKECVICLTNQKDTIAKPCKHVSLCGSCAQVVFQSEKRCPICRQGKIKIKIIYYLQQQMRQFHLRQYDAEIFS